MQIHSFFFCACKNRLVPQKLKPFPGSQTNSLASLLVGYTLLDDQLFQELLDNQFVHVINKTYRNASCYGLIDLLYFDALVQSPNMEIWHKPNPDQPRDFRSISLHNCSTNLASILVQLDQTGFDVSLKTSSMWLNLSVTLTRCQCRLPF